MRRPPRVALLVGLGVVLIAAGRAPKADAPGIPVTFSDVSREAGILAPGGHYAITAVSYDFDNDL